MDISINKNKSTENELRETADDYEKAGMDLLRDGLNRSYTERFLFTTRLYKIQQTINKAKITHKPDNLDK